MYAIISLTKVNEMFIKYNINPQRKNVGDCTIRAISKALDQSWEETYTGIALEGFAMCDMPSANHVWGAYLRSKRFTRKIIPESCPIDYTVKDFSKDNPQGTYILALSGHVVAVVDGDYYDTWDSGDETPIYYWERIDK